MHVRHVNRPSRTRKVLIDTFRQSTMEWLIDAISVMLVSAIDVTLNAPKKCP
jgi:hypothetical protein